MYSRSWANAPIWILLPWSGWICSASWRRRAFSISSATCADCKEIYDLARVTSRAVNNPVDGLDKFLQSKQSENYAHISEERLQKLLRAMTAYSGARAVKLGLRLLIINGMRPSEVREAHWSEFDLEGVMWTIPAERMKKGREYLVPLSTQSLAILQ